MENNELCHEKFMFQLIYNISQINSNYPVKIYKNRLLLDKITDFNVHLKQHFSHNIKYENDYILINSPNTFYIILFCIYTYIGIPMDVTKIIGKYCTILRKPESKLFNEYGKLIFSCNNSNCGHKYTHYNCCYDNSIINNC